MSQHQGVARRIFNRVVEAQTRSVERQIRQYRDLYGSDRFGR